MRVRQAIFTLLALTVLISVIPAQSAVPPKAGAVCTKSGVTKNYQGKTYTCIKSGKKLIWNMGVVIKKSAPGPSPTSVASQNPLPAQSPIPNPSLSPTPSQTPTPTPTIRMSFAERWNTTGSSAVAILEKSFSAKPGAFPKVEIIWRYSDTVDAKIKEEIAKSYAQSAEFWSSYTKITGQLQVIVGTLDDIEFICRWRDSHLQMNDSNCTKNFRTDKSRLWDAHTTQLSGKATDFYFITSPTTLTVIDFLPRVQHEFFHDIQHAQTNKYKSIFPCWVEEAGAEYFGALVASKGDPETFLKLRHFSVTATVGRIQSTNSSKTFWREWLLSTDMTSIKPGSSEWGCAPVQMEGIYHYGILATEYLNQELGIPGILALYRDAGDLGWDRAIEKAFNKPKIDVYNDIATYMDKEYRITSNQTWARHNCIPQGNGLQCSGGL